MQEWLNWPLSKSGKACERLRGFESLPFRQNRYYIALRGATFYYFGCTAMTAPYTFCTPILCSNAAAVFNVDPVVQISSINRIEWGGLLIGLATRDDLILVLRLI